MDSANPAGRAAASLKFKLVVAYDGGGYSGWQIQKVGVGVQEKLEAALRRLFPGAGRVHGSSRTDTGVHALGMVAHFEIPRDQFKMPVRKLALALNAHLPEDIRVMKAVRAHPEFHARFDAVGKQYRYLVWNDAAMDPLRRHQAWFVPGKLDRTAMRAAAGQFVGKRDFKALAGSRAYEMESTVRTVTRCNILGRGKLITFVIEGNGFLYKMCRGIVGTLIQVGQGKIVASQIDSILAARDRRRAGMTAPAHGLVLWKVYY